MTNSKHVLLTTAALLTLSLAPLVRAQEGIAPTQALVFEDTKTPQPLTPANTTLKVDNHPTPITSLTQVIPTGAQVALLIDDGLRTSFGRNLDDIRHFITTLPPGTEILVGYMQNGTVRATPFTANHEAAAKAVRNPIGLPGISASPYFCLSEFVKHWPSEMSQSTSEPEGLAPIGDATPSGGHKARFVMMITNGVDPYNGSTSVLNQDSPYVQTAIRDAQRSGAAIYSIYFTDAGIRGGRASFSGQSYLTQVADATGGTAYYQGTFNPVSLIPFFEQFDHAIAETYVATFPASGKDTVRVKLTTNLSKTKLRHADEVRPGTRLAD
ncbi:hypothetical protein [Granulicella sibirica]|uniref:VWFA domain-containing protein n=1 Tax=Granulicella sibirica TaxID=2479048 RepID=A0A4Q0T260_9BACT|nr:hypothetical protein [Granulicella sibirica]RXH55999.1 hypothetical protein GRAN_2856 [Granulicella sibirica]